MDDSEPEPLKKHHKEVKKASSLATSVINKEQMSNLVQWLECFSGWYRANRVVAVCLRYQRIPPDRVHGRMTQTEGVNTRFASHKHQPVNVEELQAAEEEIIRETQREAFKEEITKLKNKGKDTSLLMRTV